MLGVCRLEEELEEKETRGKKAQRVRAGDDKPKCHTHPLCPSPYLSVSVATTPLPALRASAQSMPLIHSQENPEISMTMKSLLLLLHLSPFLPCLSCLNPKSPSLLPLTPSWASVFTHTGGTLP